MEKKAKTNINYWVLILQNESKAYTELYLEEKKFLESNIFKNAKVLDIGCGDGRSLKSIEPMTSYFTGIDHDQKAIDLAKESFKKNKNAKFLKADAKDLPFKENTFDYVLCMGTFTNLGPLKDKSLQKMKRVLKKDGAIIILAYSERALKERLAMYKKNNIPIKKIDGTTVYFEESLGDNISEQFSKAELNTLFKTAGLKTQEIKEIQIAYICKLTK